MSDPTEPQDYFANTAAPAKAKAAAVGQPEQKSAPRPGLLSRVKGVHVFLASCAAGLLWMVLPSMGTSTDGLAPASSVGDPAASRYAADLEVSPPAAGSSVPTAIRVAAPSAEAASQVTPTATTAMAPSGAAVAGSLPNESDVMRELQALRSQVAALSTTLDSERAERAACPVNLAAARSASATIAHAAPRRALTKVAIRAPREVLGDYHLNTIYNGQAWIERANQTFVVEKGSQVGGARVERIDAVARVVETTHGDIR